MNYYNKTVTLLEEALGSSLTDTQKLMIFLNDSVVDEKFDIANFVIINRITPSMIIAKLAAFGNLVEEFWENISPEDVSEYQSNPENMISSLRKFEENYTDMISLDYLEKYDFDVTELSKKIPYAMLKALNNNKKLVSINMEYLIKLGVSNYKEIFEAYYELFLMDPSNFEEIFIKYDQEDLVSKLEKNIGILEYL